MIRFDNGLVLSVEASFSLNIKEPKGDIEFFGTKAGAKLSPEVEIFTDEQGYLVNVSFDKDTSLSFDGLFAGEINHFVDCSLNNVPCRAPAEDGVELMKILDAIYESAKTDTVFHNKTFFKYTFPQSAIKIIAVIHKTVIISSKQKWIKQFAFNTFCIIYSIDKLFIERFLTVYQSAGAAHTNLRTV